MSNIKHYPFDLQRALAGEPLVTKSGDSVVNFRRISSSKVVPAIGYEYMACIRSNDRRFDGKGCSANSIRDDLFMLTPTTTSEDAPKPTTTIAFDLQKALAGDKVEMVSREHGETVPVLEIFRSANESNPFNIIVGISDWGYAYRFNSMGECSTQAYTLRMAPIQHSGFIILLKADSTFPWASTVCIYNTMEEAHKEVSEGNLRNCPYTTIVPISWTE